MPSKRKMLQWQSSGRAPSVVCCRRSGATITTSNNPIDYRTLVGLVFGAIDRSVTLSRPRRGDPGRFAGHLPKLQDLSFSSYVAPGMFSTALPLILLARASPPPHCCSSSAANSPPPAKPFYRPPHLTSIDGPEHRFGPPLPPGGLSLGIAATNPGLLVALLYNVLHIVPT